MGQAVITFLLTKISATKFQAISTIFSMVPQLAIILGMPIISMIVNSNYRSTCRPVCNLPFLRK